MKPNLKESVACATTNYLDHGEAIPPNKCGKKQFTGQKAPLDRLKSGLMGVSFEGSSSQHFHRL